MTEDEFVKSAMSWFRSLAVEHRFGIGQTVMRLYGPPWAITAENNYGRWIYTQQSGRWMPSCGRLKFD